MEARNNLGESQEEEENTPPLVVRSVSAARVLVSFLPQHWTPCLSVARRITVNFLVTWRVFLMHKANLRMVDSPAALIELEWRRLRPSLLHWFTLRSPRQLQEPRCGHLRVLRDLVVGISRAALP